VLNSFLRIFQWQDNLLEIGFECVFCNPGGIGIQLLKILCTRREQQNRQHKAAAFI
jgi:hypothetical protein